MQVLKFGGSSVADAQSMSQVIDIVTKAVDRDRTILVSSAVSGCTDTLITIGNLASQRDESYKTLIDELQNRFGVRLLKRLMKTGRNGTNVFKKWQNI